MESSLRFIQTQSTRLDFGGYGLSDAEIYALREQKQEALTILRQAIDEGWRFRWWYSLEHNPNVESIRSEPQFKSMLAEIKAGMAEQLVRVKAMEKAGGVCINL